MTGTCSQHTTTLPASVPQSHRWQLFRLHLNGIYTAARVGIAGVADPNSNCWLCRGGTDSVAHITACPVVLRAWRRMPWPDGALPYGFSLPSLFFQTPGDGLVRFLALAFFCAVLSARRQLQLLSPVRSADAEGLILKMVQCPWVSCSLPTLSRKERRDARVQPPELVHGRPVYRADGVIRRKALGGPRSGWGALRLADGHRMEGARGRMSGSSSGNLAMYQGLLACMLRALERSEDEKSVVFELSSSLVVRQMRPFGLGKYACRSPSLQPTFLRCIGVGRRLDDAGVQWEVRHIYAEHNRVARILAKQALAQGSVDWHF